MASSVENKASMEEELSAPQGWKKMIMQKKSNTPKRGAVIFVSPTGDEIKSKTQLDRYLKSHPGGPSSSEFDWSTGETPRRSRRISEKFKPTESPERDSPKKRKNKSISKAEADNEDEAVEEEDTVAEKTEDQVMDEIDKEEEHATEEPMDDKKEESEEKRELEGTSEPETEKADEKTVCSVAHAEKVETEIPAKPDDDSKEEKKPDPDPPTDNEATAQPSGLEEKTTLEPKSSEVSC